VVAIGDRLNTFVDVGNASPVKEAVRGLQIMAGWPTEFVEVKYTAAPWHFIAVAEEDATSLSSKSVKLAAAGDLLRKNRQVEYH